MPLKGSYYFTWSSRQCQEIRIHSRIDWVFCNAEWMIRFSTKVLVKDGLSDRSYPSLFLLLLKLCTKVIEASGFVTRAKLMILLLRLLRTFGIRRSKGAFIRGSKLVHNVLLCYELARGYHRKYATPRCMLKLDLRKANDTMSWKTIIQIMELPNFPTQFVSWVAYCIQTTSFSIQLNGEKEWILQG